MKRLAIDCKKILAKHISDRGLASRIYEEHLQLNKENNPVFLKRGKDLNRHLTDAQHHYYHVNSNENHNERPLDTI